MALERTLSIVKPDGVSRNLIGGMAARALVCGIRVDDRKPRIGSIGNENRCRTGRDDLLQGVAGQGFDAACVPAAGVHAIMFDEARRERL